MSSLQAADTKTPAARPPQPPTEPQAGICAVNYTRLNMTLAIAYTIGLINPSITLQETNISLLGKRNIIFKSGFKRGYLLFPLHNSKLKKNINFVS